MQDKVLDRFFEGSPLSRAVFDALAAAIGAMGSYTLRVTKSQVAFVHHKPFARAWLPSRYLHGRGAPLVLTLSFTFRHASPRWKQVVQPVPGRFTHHLELFSPADVDAEVCELLKEARTTAGG